MKSSQFRAVGRAAFGARVARAGLAVLLLGLAAEASFADFEQAAADYAKGNFAAARLEFLSLAELGDGASQFNLGAMTLRGEGIEKHRGTAVGFMVAAAENGYEGLPAGRLAQLRGALAPEEESAARAVLARYGHAAIAANVFPGGPGAMVSCKSFAPPGELTIANATDAVTLIRQDAFVVVNLTIGADGLARDPEVLLAVPPGRMERETITSLLRSRYRPAARDGSAVDGRYRRQFTFTVEGGGRLWNVGKFKDSRKLADQAIPSAQYIVGVAAVLDETLGIPADTAKGMLLSSAQGGEPNAQHWLSRELDRGPFCTDRPRELLWLRQAARRGNAHARVMLARALLDDPAAPANVDEARALLAEAAAGEDPFVLKHAIAMLLDARLAPVDPALLKSAAERLAKHMLGVDPQEYEVGAAAAAAQGDFQRAARLQEKALREARELYWNTDVLEERFARYRDGRMWSGDLLALPPRATPPPPVTGRTLEPCKPGKKCGGRERPDAPEVKTGTRIPQ